MNSVLFVSVFSGVLDPIRWDLQDDNIPSDILTDENGEAITDLPGGDTIETIS